jgi:putative transposase
MYLTKKIEIALSAEALEKLWSTSSLCTRVFNAGLEQRRDKKSYGKVNIYSQKKELRALKKEFPEFKKPSSQVLQNSLFSLDRAYKMFFTKHKNGDKEARPPKFRSSKYFFTQEYSQKKTSFDLSTPGQLAIAYGSSRKDWIIIDVPEAGYEGVKTVKIAQDKMNKKWFACLTYEVKEKALKTSGHVLYFDPGCKTTLTGIKTTGEFFEYDFNALRKINDSTYHVIDELKSRRDKKKNRSSQAFRRLTKRINALFAKINTRTKTYLHSLANHILKEHPDVKAFKIGDWDKRKTLADTGSTFVNKTINRAVQNNNPLCKLIDILTYKARIDGQEVSKVDERGTTRTCSKCDYVHKGGLSPTKRTFVCESCGFTFPRDHQSCLNLLKRFESALWLRLPDILSGSSSRMGLAPFSFKPQRSVNQLITGVAS